MRREKRKRWCIQLKGHRWIRSSTTWNVNWFLVFKLVCTDERNENRAQPRGKGRRTRRAQSTEREGMTCPTKACQRKVVNNDNHHMCGETRNKKNSHRTQAETRVRPIVRRRGALRLRCSSCLHPAEEHARIIAPLLSATCNLEVPQMDSLGQNSLLALLRCREWSDTGTRKASPG